MPLLQSLPSKSAPVNPTAAPAVIARPKKAKRASPLRSELLFNRPWCIRRDRLEAMVAEFVNGVSGAGYGNDDDEDEQDEDCPYDVTADGIAKIPVYGPLMAVPSWRGTSYPEVCEMADHAYANPAVKAVLFSYDSPGGTASGMFECSQYLYGLRDQKPTAAMSDDNCYSAAYCLASSAPQLFVNKYTGGVGSVGCWTAHVDLSEMDKQAGIKVTYVYAGEKKVDGNAHEPLSGRAKNDMQEECDACRDQFVAAVARYRGVSADELYSTEAGTYMRNAGVPLLADQVGTEDDALNYLRGQVAAKEAAASSPSDSEKNDGTMTLHLKVEGLDELMGKLEKAQTSAVKLAADLEPGVALLADQSMPRSIAALFHHICNVDRKFAVDVLDIVEGAPDGQVRTYHPAGLLAIRCASERASVLSSGTGRLIRCCIAPYNKLSADLGGFKEVYSPGCFSEWLASSEDGRALFNHNSDFVLGRRSANTVRFFEQPDGFYFEAEAPNTQWADDLLVSMRRGDIDGGSAAFYILQPRWEYRDGGKVRLIEKARLVEGSIASFPIYESSYASVQQPAPNADAGSNELARAKLSLLRLR